MGQRPVAIRIRVDKPNVARGEHVVVGVAEAARRLNVSERTVYRMLKSGELERGNIAGDADTIGSNMSDMTVKFKRDKSRQNVVKMSELSDMNDADNASDTDGRVDVLQRQVGEKDAQIAQLLTTQQELTRTIQRLQEQMYELAHLVLSHNAVAAQAKAEAELKAQQAQAKNKSGLAGLLGSRGRK